MCRGPAPRNDDDPLPPSDGLTPGIARVRACSTGHRQLREPSARRAWTTTPGPRRSPDRSPRWFTSIFPTSASEHVGSTSVPGCAGKGIVDLMIAVADEEMAAVKELLDRLGFQQQTGRDAFPEDPPDAARIVRPRWRDVPGPRPRHPGQFARGGRNAVLPRLPAADPELLHAYVARKREILAGGVTDSLEYCRLKGEFIKEMLR